MHGFVNKCKFAFLENATTVEIMINSLTTHIKLKCFGSSSNSTGNNVNLKIFIFSQ